MPQGNGFIGLVFAVYLVGGFILGGLSLALQIVVYRFAQKPGSKTAPLKVGMFLWIAMIVTKLLGVHGFVGTLAGGLYSLLCGWVYPYDLLAFALCTVPVMGGLVTGVVISRRSF